MDFVIADDPIGRERLRRKRRCAPVRHRAVHLLNFSRATQADATVRGHASGFPSPALSAPLRFARLRRDSSPAAGSGNSENRLLRENADRFREARLRSPNAEARSGPAMLRRLRIRSGRYPGKRDALYLSVGGRRKLCRLHFVRAFPLATASGSTAARLIRFANRLVLHLRDEIERNSTGGFHEILIHDYSGPGADRHSERDFELG